MNYSGEWWIYERPPTIYDMVGNNFLTLLLRPFLYIVVKFYFRYFHKLQVLMPEFDLEKGGYIIAANHSSHLDTPLIFSCFPFRYLNRIYAVAAADYFFTNPILKLFAHILCNIIPISRESADFRSLSLCSRILEKGGNVLIYPEGTRTRTGEMGVFKPGVGILVRKSGNPVVPVFISGTFKSMNYRRIVPKFTPISIVFGKEIPYKILSRGNSDARSIARKIQDAVVDISKKSGIIGEQ